MTTRQILPGLIVVTAGVFALIFSAAQEYSALLCIVALGAIWIALELSEYRLFSAVFFTAFAAFAVVAALEHASIPLILLGLCADLAAWDLSRFRDRLRDEEDETVRAALERAHLRMLAVPIVAGFLIALVPLFVTLSISFIALAVIVLIALLVLRQSLVTLRGAKPNQ